MGMEFLFLCSTQYRNVELNSQREIFISAHPCNKPIPSLVSEDVPDILIADLSQQMTKQWKLVAVYLGFTNDHVATFDAENDSVAEKVIAMLSAWKHSQAKDATRSNLMKALMKVGRKDLAEKVCSYQE